MKIVYDYYNETYVWLSKRKKDFYEFESYCLLVGIDVNYSPTEYSIKACRFEKGDTFPNYYHLDILREEEQALIEFAKIKNAKIELRNIGHRNNDPEQGKCLYPYEPADGDRVFGKDS